MSREYKKTPPWMIAIASRPNIMAMQIVGDSWRDFVSEDDIMSWETMTVKERVDVILKADAKFKARVNDDD